MREWILRMNEQELWNYFIEKLISAAEKWKACFNSCEDHGFDDFEDVLYRYVDFLEFLREDDDAQAFTVRSQFFEPCWEKLVEEKWHWDNNTKTILDMMCEIDSRFNVVRILFV